MAQKRNILITGATGGIGGPVVEALAGPDNHLILIGRTGQTLANLKESVNDAGGSCTLYEADLAEEKDIEDLCERVRTDFSSLDWIVHGAGFIDEKESVGASGANSVRAAFFVNVISYVIIVQSLQALLTERGGVLAISSTASLRGNPGFPVYAATKSALNTFTRSFADRYEGTGRAAIVICPGGTNTPMRERIAHDANDQQSPSVVAEVVSEIVEGRSEFKNKDLVVVKDGVRSRVD